MKQRHWGRLLFLLLILGALAALFFSPLGDWLTLGQLKASRAALAGEIAARPLLYIGAFFLLYVAAAALSLPGAVILTLSAGALFGLWTGLATVAGAATLGGTFAFLSSRYLLRDWVKARFGTRVDAVDRGIEKHGPFYLLTLRLNPAVPYWLVNLAMGLTRMRVATFVPYTLIGILPASFIYVNAGTQLAAIERTEDILSPRLLGALLLLSLFPLIAARVAEWLRVRRLYRRWRRPRRFDRNLIVVGAGAGGLVTSYIAAALRAKVTLVEAREMGGDCLNTGCVPSKALIASAKAAHAVAAARDFGVEAQPPRVRFREVMERVHAAIAAIAPNDSVERYTGLGVEVRRGHARLVDPWTVEIDGGERLTSRAIVIAAGAEPAVPPIPGLEGLGYLTSDTMWTALRRRDEVPARIAVIGGGPIGCELAQAFVRLGSRVVQVEQGPRLLAQEDPDAAALIAETLRAEGVDIRTATETIRVEGKSLVLRSATGEEESLAFDELIVAVGRKARLAGYGLEELGIETDRTIVANDWLETLFPNIYAVGDVAGPYQLTHFAAHQAGYAALNALFGSVKRFRADYSVVPRVTFTDPELAQVGHSEASAREAAIPFETIRYGICHLDRAVADGTARGFVKLLTVPGKDRIVGATVVGAAAGETVAAVALAMRHRIGLKKILGTVHAYPTMAEAPRYAAGEWRRAHQPERLLRLAERWHAWRRG
jgi:pyruvate/2-oxoglutarate dehydrogenase complex dihydrolipoamide dehydrogenase (E3) component/uncharacterized membrane protein YdjX (TVP38/TMEM64 family)